MGLEARLRQGPDVVSGVGSSTPPRGGEWFVSNGVGVARHEGTWRSVLWVPTVGYGIHVDDQRAGFIFATGLVGGHPPDCGTPPCRGGAPAQRTFLLVGITIERWSSGPRRAVTR